MPGDLDRATLIRLAPEPILCKQVEQDSPSQITNLAGTEVFLPWSLNTAHSSPHATD